MGVRDGFKLFRLRKDGTLGSLFIDRKRKLSLNTVYQSKSVRTNGFAYRPGWHVLSEKYAPHLSKKDRVWCRVTIWNHSIHHRPKNQGGLWYTGTHLHINEIL